MSKNRKKGCLISLAIFLVFVGLAIVFIFYSISKYTKPKTVDINKNSYVRLNLSGNLKYQKQTKLFNVRNFTYFDLINSLDKIKRDHRVKGIIIENMNLPRAQMEEVIKKIKEIKKHGKKVYAFVSNFNRNSYYPLTVADNIILTPSESDFLMLRGYYYSKTFYKGLLDKLGIDFNVIHIGNYKGAGEGFSRKNMSRYLKENMKNLMDGLYNYQVKQISKNRNFNKNKFEKKLLNGDYFLMSPEKALDSKLVDYLYYEDEFYKKYKIDRDKIININNYAASVEKNIYKRKIAVIIAKGEIRQGKSRKHFSPLMGMSHVLGSDTFIKNINDAVENNNVKGIVIRVDSPGGSALASDLMWNAIEKAKKKKPVYVSMGNIAASGGYYISCNADKIYASNNTITGSIGVVAMVPNYKDFMEDKLYLDYDSIKKGKYSEFMKSPQIMNNEEKQIMKKSMVRTYEEFKSRVAAGREKSKKYIQQIAQGKVYTGIKAKKIGLVDEIASFEEVVEDFKKKLNIKRASLIYYPKPKTFFEKLKEGNSFVKSKINFMNSMKNNLNIYTKPQYLFPYYDVAKTNKQNRR